MADEKLKIKIVPEYLPHYIGEVEIDCLPLNKIKTQADMFDVIQELRTLLTRVKGAGFMQAVFPNGELLKKISVIDFMFMDYDKKTGKGKLNRDEKYKQLTEWFIESLERTISNCENKMQYLQKSDDTSQRIQGETPCHIQDLIELGYIDKNYRNIQKQGLQGIIDYVHKKYPAIIINYQFIKQFKKSNGKDYGDTIIYNILSKIKAETQY